MRNNLMALLAAASLVLAACGGAGDTADDVTASPASGESAPGASADSSELPTAPIPFRDLYDSRGGEPYVGTEEVQLDTCPLLSLDTLNANSGAYSDPTVLSTATTQRCVFSNGPAFSFTVEIEPAAEVDVDNHSGRAYNIDVEPIVEPQSGPGEKAVILIDTAFAETLDNEGVRYLYFFVLGDKAVTLRSAAFKVDPDGWRALADEVAANIESGQAGGEVETVEVVDEVEAYTIEPCGFISIDQLAAVAGVAPADITPNHDAVSTVCGWTFADGGVLNFRFRAAERTYPEGLSAGQQPLDGALSNTLALGSEFIYEVWLNETDRWGFQVDAGGPYGEVGAVIAANLAPRIEPGPPIG